MRKCIVGYIHSNIKAVAVDNIPGVISALKAGVNVPLIRFSSQLSR